MPSLCGERRVAAKPARISDQEHSNPIATLGQEPRGDKSIATVIARAGHDGDPAAHGMADNHSLRDCATGALHKVGADGATGNRQAVRLCHFDITEKLDHTNTR